MRPMLTAACAAMLAMTALAAEPVPTSSAGDDVGPMLIALEKQSWVAWKAHDGAFFSSFLSDDHVEVSARGISDKKNVVAGVVSPICTVDDYAVDQFRVTRLSAEAALVVYHARQRTLCGKIAVPSPVWVSSLYVRRNGRWLNALFQQTPTGG
jgi:uncharacterized protein DUF4440